MKKLWLLALVVPFVISTNAYANYSTDSMPEYAPVVHTENLSLSSTVDWDYLYINWNDWLNLSNESFKYWKLMKWENMDVPYYPDQSAAAVYSERQSTKHKISKSTHTKYFRICMITARDSTHPKYNEWKYGRYCSSVLKLEPTSVWSSTNTTPTPTLISNDWLSSVMKSKINALADRLMNRINTLSGNDTTEKMRILNNIISKLNELSSTKPQLANIFNYLKKLMQEELNLLEVESLLEL